MGIGGSIFLIAVGALLAFAVDFQLWWIDISVAGWILIVAGVLGLVLTVVLWNRRRAASTVAEHHYREREDAGPGYGPPPP